MFFIFVHQPRTHFLCFSLNHALLKETTRYLYYCTSHYDTKHFKFSLTHALLYSSSGDPGPDEQHAGGVRRRDRVHVQTRNDSQGLLQGLWSSMEVSTPTRSC